MFMSTGRFRFLRPTSSISTTSAWPLHAHFLPAVRPGALRLKNEHTYFTSLLYISTKLLCRALTKRKSRLQEHVGKMRFILCPPCTPRLNGVMLVRRSACRSNPRMIAAHGVIDHAGIGSPLLGSPRSRPWLSGRKRPHARRATTTSAHATAGARTFHAHASAGCAHRPARRCNFRSTELLTETPCFELKQIRLVGEHSDAFSFVQRYLDRYAGSAWA